MSDPKPKPDFRDALLAQEPAAPAEAYQEYRRMLEQQLLEAAPAVQQQARKLQWRRRGFGFLAIAAGLALAVAASYAFLGDSPQTPNQTAPTQPGKPGSAETMIVLGGPLPNPNAPQAPRMHEPLANYFLENVEMILIGIVDDPIERQVALPKKNTGLGGLFEKTEYRTEKLFRVAVDKILYGSFDGKQVQMNDSKPILGCIPTADEMRRPTDDFAKGSKLLIYLAKHNDVYLPRQFTRLDEKEAKLPDDLVRFLAFADAGKAKDPRKVYRELLDIKGLDVPAYVALSRTRDKAAADVLVDLFDVFYKRGLQLDGPVLPGQVGKMTASLEFQRLLALFALYGETRKLDAILKLPVEYRSLSYLEKMCRGADAKELARVRDTLLPLVQPANGQQDQALIVLAGLSSKMDAASQGSIRKLLVTHLQAIKGNDDSYVSGPLLQHLLATPDNEAIDIVLGMVARQPVGRINELCQESLWSATIRMSDEQHARVVKRWQELADALQKKAQRSQEEENLLRRLQGNIKQPRPNIR